MPSRRLYMYTTGSHKMKKKYCDRSISSKMERIFSVKTNKNENAKIYPKYEKMKKKKKKKKLWTPPRLYKATRTVYIIIYIYFFSLKKLNSSNPSNLNNILYIYIYIYIYTVWVYAAPLAGRLHGRGRLHGSNVLYMVYMGAYTDSRWMGVISDGRYFGWALFLMGVISGFFGYVRWTKLSIYSSQLNSSGMSAF